MGEEESNSESNGGASHSPAAPYVWEDVILPSSIMPIHYNITLQPDMDTFGVNGTSEIEE